MRFIHHLYTSLTHYETVYFIVVVPWFTVSFHPLSLPTPFTHLSNHRSYGVFLYELVTGGSVPYATFNNNDVSIPPEVDITLTYSVFGR